MKTISNARIFALLLSLTTLVGVGLAGAQSVNCVKDQYGNQLFCTNPQTITNAANLLQNNAIQALGISSNVTNIGILSLYVLIALLVFAAIAFVIIRLYGAVSK